MDYIRDKSLTMQLDRVLHPENWNTQDKWKEKLKERKLLPSQLKSLRDYNQELEATNKKLITRANKIVDVLQIFFRRLKKDPNKITEADLKKYFSKYNYYNAYADKFNKGTIKMYFKWLYGVKERGKYPDIVDWIVLPKTELPDIQKKECLTYDEVKKMISTAKSIRDKCIVAVLYDGGMRASELLNIRLKDVEINERDAVIKVETSKVKNGNPKFREILLVDSYYYLQLWLREHPQKDNQDSFLFINYNFKTDNKQLGYQGLYAIIVSLAKRSGINKKFNPHWFRHSAVKNSEGELSDAEQRVRYGWEAGSKMIGRYSGLTSEDVIEKQRQLKGLSKEEVKESNKPIWKECPRCLQSNNLTITNWCSRCGGGLSIKAIQEKETFEQELTRDITRKLLDPKYSKIFQEQLEILVKESIKGKKK